MDLLESACRKSTVEQSDFQKMFFSQMEVGEKGRERERENVCVSREGGMRECCE